VAEGEATTKDGVGDGELVSDGETEGESDPVGVMEGEDPSVIEGVLDKLTVELGVGLGVARREKVELIAGGAGDTLIESEEEGVGVGEGENVAEGDTVPETDEVGDTVAVTVGAIITVTPTHTVTERPPPSVAQTGTAKEFNCIKGNVKSRECRGYEEVDGFVPPEKKRRPVTLSMPHLTALLGCVGAQSE